MTTANIYAAHKIIKAIINEYEACKHWDEDYIAPDEFIINVIRPAAKGLEAQIEGMPIQDRNQGEANYTFVANKLGLESYMNDEKLLAGHRKVIEAIKGDGLLAMIEEIVDSAF